MQKLFRSPLIHQIKLFALGVSFLVGAVVIVAYNALAPSGNVVLAAGQVTSGDILAPMSITYESDVLTRLARQAASDAVSKVYDPPNPGVLRQQIQTARHVLDYINSIRYDSYASRDQRIADLKAIDVLNLSEDVYASLLALSDNAWRDIDAQVMSLLERTMRGEIREDNMWAVYDSLPNLVSVNVSESQATLIVALVKTLIKPNAFANDERTNEAKKAAAAAVPAVTRSFIQGQIVVRAGAVVSDADMEALTQLKLLQPSDQRMRTLLGAVLAVMLVSTLLVTYLRRFQPDLFQNVPLMVLVGVLFLLFLIGARLFDAREPFLSHLYPAAAFTLIMVAVTESQVAIAMTGALAVLVSLITGNSLESGLLVAIGGVAGVLALRRVERLNAYFAAGLVIGVVNVAVGLIFGLLQNVTDPAWVLSILPAGILGGALAAGLGLVGLYLSSSLLNIPTSVRLLELSQPSQSLLQRLLREAPGTYQHSLQVANLAELAAERIGANAALVRVGALYHDIGKLTAPLFFGENQAEGFNPHEQFTYEESARIIISHVTEGEKLGRKNGLPKEIIDFVMQHHGTTRALYFYHKALEAVDCDESKVNAKYFTYPGPRPQTREAAIMMLADASESIVRAKRTRNKQEIADVVHELVETRLAAGELDESDLTVSELKIIQDVFVTSLQGVFHPRIAYPTTPRSTQEMAALPAPTPALPAPGSSTSNVSTGEAQP